MIAGRLAALWVCTLWMSVAPCHPPTSPSCDNQKYYQTLPDIFWGGEGGARRQHHLCSRPTILSQAQGNWYASPAGLFSLLIMIIHHSNGYQNHQKPSAADMPLILSRNNSVTVIGTVISPDVLLTYLALHLSGAVVLKYGCSSESFKIHNGQAHAGLTASDSWGWDPGISLFRAPQVIPVYSQGRQVVCVCGGGGDFMCRSARDVHRFHLLYKSNSSTLSLECSGLDSKLCSHPSFISSSLLTGSYR